MRGWSRLRTLMAASLPIVVAVSFLLALLPWNVSLTVTPSGAVSLSTDVALAASIAPVDTQTGQPLDIGDEVVSKRTQTSKTYWLGNNTYKWQGGIDSIHYQENPDNLDGPWLEIETAITPSAKPNWDWEIVKGIWTLLIANDTSVALGKDGHWIGYRFEGVGYLNIVNKDYVSLFTRQSVVPTVADNTITWTNIVPGVTIEYVYGADGFKENIYVSQAARNWLVAHPPADYGIPNNQAYLGAYFECDWLNAYPAEDSAGNPISWEDPQDLEEGIFFRHPIKSSIVTYLPVGDARHIDDESGENLVPIHMRLWKQNDKNWLVLGAKVTLLNGLDEGTVIFDPTAYQTAASADDGYELESTGAVNIDDDYIYMSSNSADSGRRWGGMHWSGMNIPQGATITTAYTSHWGYTATNDNINHNIHFQLAAAPGVLTTAAGNISGRSRTTTSVLWKETGVAVAEWVDSDSLITPLHEVVTSYTVTAIVAIYVPNSDTNHRYQIRAWDYDVHALGPKLTIAYTAACTEDISNTPATYSFGAVATNTSYNSTINYFTVTNNSGGAIDVTIQATNMTTVGAGGNWTLTDDATNGASSFGLKVGLDDGDDNFDIIVKLNSPYNDLVTGLTDSGTQDWGLWVWLPTFFDSGDIREGTVTLTGVCQ